MQFDFFFSTKPRAVCEYFAHVECQDFAVPDCKENATYVPGKELSSVKHQVGCAPYLLSKMYLKILKYISLIASLARRKSATNFKMCILQENVLVVRVLNR